MKARSSRKEGDRPLHLTKTLHGDYHIIGNLTLPENVTLRVDGHLDVEGDIKGGNILVSGQLYTFDIIGANIQAGEVVANDILSGTRISTQFDTRSVDSTGERSGMIEVRNLDHHTQLDAIGNIRFDHAQDDCNIYAADLLDFRSAGNRCILSGSSVRAQKPGTVGHDSTVISTVENIELNKVGTATILDSAQNAKVRQVAPANASASYTQKMFYHKNIRHEKRLAIEEDIGMGIVHNRQLKCYIIPHELTQSEK